MNLVSDYNTAPVQNFFHDLITQAALEQGSEPPAFESRRLTKLLSATKGLKTTFHTDKYDSDIGLGSKVKEVNRDRKFVAPALLTVMAVQEEYLAMLDRDFDKVKTKGKLTRGVATFVDLMGDLPLAQITSKTAYDYADALLAKNPTYANQTITDYVWYFQTFIKFCVRKGYMDSNPFRDIDVRKYGVPTKNYHAFSKEDLRNIFSYDWPEQERLFLSILVTTGMRLTEVATLTWERFSDAEYQGIRYFSLISTADDNVKTKNEGSIRQVPLHPDLVLPPKGHGRLFNYRIGPDGLASTSAGMAINPIISSIVSHPLKRAHSFRRTLKILLRDAGVSKEVNDFYTGHGAGDVAGTVYSGMSIELRYEGISKVHHPWLAQKA